MCQLLGISANRKVDIDFSLKEFKHRGESNYHGWGFAFIENDKWKVFKEPASLTNMDITQEKFKFKSKMIIGHVRLASCGNQSHKNTHPFRIENYVFAHNGTVRHIVDNTNYLLGRWKPKGDTDSEYAFCYLFTKICSAPSRTRDILKEEAAKIKEYGNFNILLSDREILYAYGDNSLYYVQRKAPFGIATLKDDQYEVNLREIKAPGEKAIIVATEPLTKDEEWIKIVGLNIIVNGEIV